MALGLALAQKPPGWSVYETRAMLTVADAPRGQA